MQSIEDLKNQRKLAKSQFTRAERRLNEAVSGDLELEILERRFEELSVKRDITQKSHDSYILAQMPTAEDGFEETEEEWIQEIDNRFSVIEVVTIRKIKEKKKTELQIQKTMNSDAHNEDTSFAPSCPIKLERIKIETFDGNMREYTKFKEQFQKHIAPYCPSSQVAFILKSHLSKDVKREVDELEESIDVIWERLDQKYGCKSKQVAMIIDEIEQIPRNNEKSALRLINTIEWAHRDLKRMGRAGEMENEAIISMIEKMSRKNPIRLDQTDGQKAW